MKFPPLRKTSNLRNYFCLALAVIGFNPAFAQGQFTEGNSLSNRVYNSDVVPPDYLFVVDFAITKAGTLEDILTWGQNSGAGIAGIGESFYGYVLRPNGTNFQVMTETTQLTVAEVGTNIFSAPAFGLEVGDLIAHYGRGIPLTTGTGGPSAVYDNSEGPLPMPAVGQIISLPGPDYPLYNDGGRDYAIAVLVSDLPILSITQSGTSVIVFWPATGTNTLLQTTDLAAGVWTTNTDYISTNGTNFLTITPPDGNLFFRLRNP